MDRLKLESPDLTEQNIAKIAALFPNVITERADENGRIKKAVNFALLKQELSPDVAEEGEECYEFTWVGKKASLVEGNRPIRKTLRPCPKESKNWETTGNLYIEGDNLDVLKLLQESYLNAVKMIYIDPPYNTGSDFLYKNNFALDKDEYEDQIGLYDEEGNRLFQNTGSNGRFHSDWCSMLYPRLKLAQHLLAEDGVILINMDEHEIANLQKICNEVFDETNDLGTIVWDKRNPKGDARGISYQHEYIVVYAKNKEYFLTRHQVGRPKKNAVKILKKAEQLFSRIGDAYSFDDASREFTEWVSSQPDFSGGERAYNRFDENGQVFRPVSMAWPNKHKAPDDYFIPLLHPVTHKPCPVPERGWRNPPATMRDLLSKGLILFGADETTQPNRKYFLKDNMKENIPSLLYYGGSDTDLLGELGIPFDTPKVVDVCMEHIRSFTESGDIVLDFFSGSATMAHAVMQLNAEDGGDRRFIMVQLPEPCDKRHAAYKAGYKNICEIGKERIRRAGERISAEIERQNAQLKPGREPKKLPDIGFRVLKLDSTNMKEVYYAAREYTQQMLGGLESNIKEDRTDLDLLYGVLLGFDLKLSLPHRIETVDGAAIHIVGENELIACFAEKIGERVIREIAGRKPARAVFRDSSFLNSPDKINVEEIFKLITPETTVKVI